MSLVAVRSAEYWPRLSYMAHLAAADSFIIADSFQYSRQSFQNRTRLRTPQGSQWISVPLQGGQYGRAANTVEIEPGSDWPRRHWKALTFNYRSTAFFEYYEPDILATLTAPYPNLAALNAATVRCLHRLLGLDTQLLLLSAIAPHVTRFQDVAPVVLGNRLLIDVATQATNPVQRVSVGRFSYEEPQYHQNFAGFLAGMSALDLLFNYGPEAGRLLLRGIRVEEVAGQDSAPIC